MNKIICLKAAQVKRDGQMVLNNLNLSFYQSQRTAIVGANGVGKTTLLRTIVGLEALTKGEIRLFGQICQKEKDFRKQRARIGFLFQESDDQLFCPTVLEDVAFGPSNLGMSAQQAQNMAKKSLERLGIEHLAERFTHRLSGGEKRLVCLAGLFAMQPDILLLDEPTNGVDEKNRKRLEKALMAYKGAILMVSHDQDFVKSITNTCLQMHSGQLVTAA